MEVGTEATFYLTAFGEIGAVGSVSSSTYHIGYITAISKQGIDDTVSMKLYDPDTQTFGIYECASKVRFDSEGTKLSGGDIVNKFNDTNGEFASGIKRQLIGYTLNSDGKISAVDLASVGETGEKKQSLKLIHNFSTDGALWYRSYASCMSGKVLTGTAKVFQVSPKTDSADENDFLTINLADETTYQVEAYSLSQSSFVADYICVYPKGGKTVEQTRGFLVKDIIQTADKEGNIENALEGIILASGSTSTVERTLAIEEDCDTSGLEAGDIINADLNSKEKLMSWEYIYDYSENKFVHDDFGASIGWGNYKRVVMGTVYRKSGNNVEMVIGTDATAATGHEFIIPTCFRALAMFDGEARSIDLKTFIGTMDDVTSYEDSPSEATRMICFSEWGDPRWVVFYK